MKGLNNLGNTCYFNACLQCLFQIPSLSNFLMKSSTKVYECEFMKEYIYLLRNFWIKNKDEKYCDTTKILKIFRIKFKRFDNDEEHDAHEVLSYILDLLHKGTKLHSCKRKDLNNEWNLKSNSLIKDIFYGQIRKSIVYNGGRSTSYENCATIMLTPNRNTTLEDLLTDFGRDEVIEGYTDKENKTHNISVLQHSIVNRPNVMIYCFNMFVRKFKIKIPEYIDNYKLIALCLHVGNKSNGHYVAFTKHKNEWYLKDDTSALKKQPNLNNSYYFCIFKNSES